MCKATPTTVNRLTQFEQPDRLGRSPELLKLQAAFMRSEGHKRIVAILRTAKLLQDSIDALIEDHGPDTESLFVRFANESGVPFIWQDLEVLRWNTNMASGCISGLIPGVPAGL